jgi:hypothetical protein
VVVYRQNTGRDDLMILVDQTIYDVEEFLAVFGPTACFVPEGNDILREARGLRVALYEYRRALEWGAGPHELRHIAGRLSDRGEELVEEVQDQARGRYGPNIQRVHQIGGQVQQLVLAAGRRPRW